MRWLVAHGGSRRCRGFLRLSLFVGFGQLSNPRREIAFRNETRRVGSGLSRHLRYRRRNGGGGRLRRLIEPRRHALIETAVRNFRRNEFPGLTRAAGCLGSRLQYRRC